MDIAIPGLGTQPAAPPGIHGLQLLRTLRRGWWAIIGCGVLLGVITYAGTKRLTPGYSASAIVSAEPQRFAIPQLQGAVASDAAPDPMPWVRTEAAVLRSPMLLRSAAQDLSLDQDPVFNPALRPPGLLAPVKAWLAGWLGAPSATRGDPALEQQEAVLAEVQRRLRVEHDERSFLVTVTFASPDPNQASGFVNTLLRRYLADRSAARLSANRDANAALSGRMAALRGELDAAEAQLRTMRQQNGLVTLRAGSLGQQQLEELATAAAQASSDRIQAQAAWEGATTLSRRGATAELADVVGSATMARLRDQETAAARRWGEVQSRYGPRHPDRQSAQSELAAIRAEITEEVRRTVASLQARYQAARDREAATAQQLARAREEAARAGALQDRLADMEKEVDAKRVLYQNLQEQAELTSLDPQKGGQAPGLRLVSEAVPPALPSSPKPLLGGVMGTVAGMALGGTLVLLRGRGHRGFEDEDEVAALTELPVAAVIPLQVGRFGNRARAFAGLPARVLQRRSSPEANALSLLRRRAWHVRSAAAPCTVAFVSPDPADAASLALAFGRTASADGDNALLVESRPRPAVPQHGLPDAPAGDLAAVLAGTARLRDAVRPDPDSRLAILPRGTGAVPQEPAGFEPTARIQNLLVEANDTYNLVALSAAGAQSPETFMLARIADLTVLLVDLRRSDRAAVAELAVWLRAVARDPVIALLRDA
ncbi:GumC family protein [Paracraurococcus ruber]|nr:exopolysaccharide transport family protein [Paracraurococcus ruber]